MSDINGGNLVFKAVVDDGELKKNFERAKRDVEAMAATFSKEGGSIDDVFKDVNDSLVAQKIAVKQLEGEYARLQKEIGKIGPGIGRQKLESESAKIQKELEGEIVALEFLSETSKKLNSGFNDLSKQLRFLQAEMIRMEQAGEGNTQEFKNAQAEAVRLSTSIKDVQNSVKKLGESSSAIKGVNELLRGMIGAVSAGTGVVAMFSGENQNLERIMVRLQSAMAMAIGMQEISMALDKNSAFQTVTVTKVKDLYSAALLRLTAAFGGSTMAARVFMGVITGGLTLAIGAAIYAWEKYTSKQEEARKKLEERLEVERDAKTTMFEARMELDQTIRSIERFNGTKEQEKNKVQELNKQYGEQFGHFKTLDEWYSALINKGGAYVQSLYLQARAQALLQKAVAAEVSAEEIDMKPASEFTTVWDRAASRFKAGPFKKLSTDDLNNQAKAEARTAAEQSAKAYKDQWDETLKELNRIGSQFNLGNHDEPEKAKKKDDPFIKDLEAKRKAYEDYAKAINSTDELVRMSAQNTFSKLLKGGKTYSEWMRNERNKVASDNKDLLQKWNRAIAEADTETVTGQLDERIKDIINNTANKTKEKIAEIEEIGLSISESDPLKLDKEKYLQAGLTQLRRQSVQEEKQLLEETLKQYGDFLQERMEFEKEYGERKAALALKLAEEISEEEKAVILEADKNLENERIKIKNNAKIKGVELHIKSAEFKLEKSLLETETKRYKWRADRDKARLKAQKEYNLALIEHYNLLGKLDPTQETQDRIAEALRKIGLEIAFIDSQITKIDNAKVLEMLEGIEGVAGALGQLDSEMGEVFQSISKSIGSVNQTMKDFSSDTLTSSEKNFKAAATIVEGVISLINMAASASKNRKATEREFYKNQIALAHEYALALNEQLLLQSRISGSGFIRNYAGEIKNAFSAATEAFSKYQEAIGKLEGGKANTGLKNVIDWGNVGKGAATGVAAGAAAGSVVPVIGTAIGAVVGGIVGGIVGLFSKKSKNETSGLLEIFPELVDGAGNLNKELAQTIINTNQVDEATKQLIQNALDWSGSIEKANEQIRNVVVDLAGDLGNALKDALVEAFKAGEDASSRMFEAAAKSLEKFVENLIYSTIFSKTFKDFEDRLAESLNPLSGDGNIVDDYSWLLKQMELGSEQYTDALKQIEEYSKNQGLNLWSPVSATRSESLAGAIRGMSQESANIIAGHLNAIRIDGSDAVEIWRQHLLATYQIRDNTDQIMKSNKEMASSLNNIDGKISGQGDDMRALGLV